MLEGQHSNDRLPRSHSGISKGCYKLCKVLAIYTRLIFIKVVMLGAPVQERYSLWTESTESQSLAPSENCSLLP